MHISWAFVVILRLAHFSFTTAVPVVNETVVVSSVDDCYFPEMTFSTIKNPFTLIAFTDEGNDTWPLLFFEQPHSQRAILGRINDDGRWMSPLN
jgi:hypothetical protein